MSMTREEAIVVLEESKRQNEVMRDNPSTFWASYQMADGVKNSEKRIAALNLALAALRGPTREMVERMRGEWTKDNTVQVLTPGGQKYHYRCSKCEYLTRLYNQNFCSSCGSPMTDKAVDMMLERWKEAVEGGKENP